MVRSRKAELFLLALALIFIRDPSLFTSPRLWAEEGSLFLQGAFNEPWHVALFSPRLGYLCLFTSLASTLAAKLLPLELAAGFMTAFAFLVQLLPIAMVIWGRASLWKTDWHRAAGIVILIASQNAEEVWLTTTGLHFHFAILAFLLFLEPVSTTFGQRSLGTVLLFFAGLSGPVACLLLPLFLLRAWRERDREAIVRAAALGTATLLQLVIVLVAMNAGAAEHRFPRSSFATFAFIGMAKLVLPVLGGRASVNAFADFIMTARQQSSLAAIYAYGVGSAVVVVATIATAVRFAPRDTRWWYVGAMALLFFLSIVLGVGDPKIWLHMSVSGRYFYAVDVIFLLLILSAVGRTRLATAALAVSLALQLVDLRSRSYPRDNVPAFGDEVAKWRADPSHRIGIAPTGWGFYAPADRR